MGFEVKADPATIKVMREMAAREERSRQAFLEFVGAFTLWQKDWIDNASQ